MDEFVSALIFIVFSLLVVLNPPGAMMTFASMTNDLDDRTKTRYAVKSVILGCFLSVLFAVAGEMILQLVGISVDSLKVAGGVLLFTIGYNMTNAKMTSTLTKDEIKSTQDRDFWVFPIAVPLLCGPGMISTSIILMGSYQDILYKVSVIAAIIFIYFITFFGFIGADRITKTLGYTGNLVLTRIVGLLLASLAVGMVTSGLYSIYLTLSAAA